MKIDPFSSRSRLIAVAAATLIAACGGGGGGGGNDQGAGNPPTTPPPAGGTSVLAGGWSGSAAAAGESAHVFVLADGTAWTFVKAQNEAPLDMYVGGLVLANGQLSSATGMRAFDYDARTAVGASASGTYVAQSRIDFTIRPDGAAAGVPIAVTAVGSSDYNPARAALLTDIVGAWSGRFTSNETGGVVVTSAGAINTATSAGCLSSGTLTPRVNENVFDVNVTLVATGTCLTPNAVATGTAFVVGSGTNARLYLGLKTNDGSQGATFIGAR